MKRIQVFILCSIMLAIPFVTSLAIYDENTNKLGMMTIFGCVKTTYNDSDLIKNKIFVEKILNKPTGRLCLING